MKTITIETGCTSETIEVDGVDIYNIPKEDLVQLVAEAVGQHVTDSSEMVCILMDLVREYGLSDYDDEECEQCGHHYEVQTLEVGE